jgi:E1A-binding protein p400
VLLNWEKEIKFWYPSLKVISYYGTAKERALKRVGWGAPNAFHVCVTSYNVVIQDQSVFRRKQWAYLILDEAHNIRNFKSKRWQVLLSLNAKRRLLLTGTPLQNSLMELWSLLHFLMPHIFQSHSEFKEWFSSPLDQMIEGKQNLDHQLVDRLHTVLRPFLLRRLKRDVETQLPDKHEHVVMCRLSKRQRGLYEEFLASRRVRETMAGNNVLGVMNILMQLRKVCNHPDLFEERPIMSPFDCALPYNTHNDRFSDLVPLSAGLPGHHASLVSCEVEGLPLASRNALLIAPAAPLSTGLLSVVAPPPPQQYEEVVKRRSEERRYRQQQVTQTGLWRALWGRPLYGREAIEGLTVVSTRYTSERGKEQAAAAETLKKEAASLTFVIPRARALLSRDNVLGEASPDWDAGVRAVQIRREVNFPEKRLIQYDCGKLQQLAVMLQQMHAEGHRVLIFTQMTRMLDILEVFLAFHHYNYMRLDGTTKTEKRYQMMERFNEDERIFCFILSTRSGGLGINLTGADTVIFFDSDWNPAMDAQAQDRAHRIGQTKEVNVYRLISQNTVEENILRKALQKRQLEKLTLHEGGIDLAAALKNGGKVDLRELIGSVNAVSDAPALVVDEANWVKATKQAEEGVDVEAANRYELSFFFFLIFSNSILELSKSSGKRRRWTKMCRRRPERRWTRRSTRSWGRFSSLAFALCSIRPIILSRWRRPSCRSRPSSGRPPCASAVPDWTLPSPIRQEPLPPKTKKRFTNKKAEGFY